MPLNVSVLVDHPGSYLHDYIDQLLAEIKKRGHMLSYVTKLEDLQGGELLFLLGCKAILTPQQLKLHKHNLVVHPSKLPEGRGSAALVNKILEGENTVWLTLFEALEKVDAGPIYFQESITFEGHELSDEIRKAQTMKVFALVLKYLDAYPNVKGRSQEGSSSFYKRRGPDDSELDMDKSIRDQFNLLRIVDNERYPAFFRHLGKKYVVKIYKED